MTTYAAKTTSAPAGRADFLAMCVSLLLWGGLAAELLAGPPIDDPLSSFPATLLSDSQLSSIHFADHDHGWAVGDRGVILATTNGGRTWQRQNSPVACRLAAVQFLSPQVGFAVGGWTHPYTHHTSGVVLSTRDGGFSWRVMPGLVLPRLSGLRMTSTQEGLAFGESSSLFPSGVFRTSDGGKSWHPVSKNVMPGWVAGDMRSDGSGVLVDHHGTVKLLAAQEIRDSRSPSIGKRSLHQLKLMEDGKGWLVGSAGLALTTTDGGISWTLPSRSLPEIAASDFDLHCVATYQNHVWIAGNPGTSIFYSHDGGGSWQTFRTSSHVPIQSLFFLDQQRGWAAGAMGTILATRDGGRTWRVQNSGGKEAAMLAIFSEPSRVPWEVIARDSYGDGYLAHVEILGRRETASGAQADPSIAFRTHEAALAVGGCGATTAWQFPLRSEGLSETAESIFAYWNRSLDGRAKEKIEQHLVRQIRTWRPSVILTDDVSPLGTDPLAHLTNQLVLTAVEKAADATAYPDQLASGGLEVWQARKVLAVQHHGRQGSLNVVPAQWAPRLGGAVSDIASRAKALLEHEVTSSPTNIPLAILIDHLPQGTGRRDVFSGLALTPGGSARRMLHEAPAGDLASLSKAAQKRHNVQQLLARIDKNNPTGAGWMGQIDDLTRDLPARNGGEILFQLATRYQQSGQSEQAAEVMQQLVDRYPQHPLADSAAIWLLKYLASGEESHRTRSETRYTVQLATAVRPDEKEIDDNPNLAPSETNTKQVQNVLDQRIDTTFTGAARTTTAAPQVSASERASRAINLARQIERARPTLYADPAFRFPLAVLFRAAGQPRQSEKWIGAIAASSTTDPWALQAQNELWLAHGQGQPPKRLASCTFAPAPPKLDGRLDDLVWTTARPISLVDPAGSREQLPAAVVVVTYDREFLYLAASVQKHAAQAYPVDDAPRTYDADLAKFDRLQIALDLDRDYQSFYQIDVDSRGFTSDQSLGDKTWNPQYYVARGGDDAWWTIEMAIPFAELSSQPAQSKDAWGIAVMRVLPTVGVQAITPPESATLRPEGLGLLLFD
ncbi:Uncharacterized photosystem II stability/assembly factor-like protein [Pirellula staleyi DSM 6068]|uniref:Uncharacterized photosystem II stability/assembly factor-like protein n=1 Tax=Pirellula staleyi (strain ATCC 27377 / DSM 6068 / ICPB 4128) TaxID=530564 RepID=D2R7B8_PIRSD|nr:YCF48-related protein [Pirellula staleyi]ADB15614.1 Uncharacterized photosystem II stability/assembly factor-like protein [Pirellula staleyi DSM 6068]